jgi:hypothetical protein
MNNLPRAVPIPLLVCMTLAVSAAAAPPQSAATTSPTGPRVFLLHGEELQAARQRLRDGDEALKPARLKLERDARAAMTVGPFSVTSKKRTPPGGDKHDYMSQAPYWWPDPAKPDGLPYVQRDGQRNPEIYEITDAANLKKMGVAVETLAFAYYFTGDEQFADRAAVLLRTWFLDEPTRMNPNLRFAQAVLGVNDGRGTGIIESVYLMYVVDAVGLLHGSSHWTDADDRAMREWFAQYLRWMLDSKPGKDEAAAKNNHGTYFDAQAATFALLTGDAEVAKRIIEQVPAKRIAVQVEPDGRQPLELRRTKAWSYSIMNARGLMLLARLGEHVGIDLWHNETPDGRGIRKAIDFLAPFATGEQKWPYEQINGFRPEGGAILLRRAAREYPEQYAAVAKKLPPLPDDAVEHLIGARLTGNPVDSK